MEQIQEENINNDYIGMATCFLCGETKHLLMDKRLKKSLPQSACYDKEPCDKCKEIMKQGVFLIGVRKGEQGDNPFRTGQIIALKDEAIKKMVNEPLLSDVLKKRICYVEEEILSHMGLLNKNKEIAK